MAEPSHIPEFFGALALLVLVAHVGGRLAVRARLPSVVGELASGIALAAAPGAFLRGVRGDGLLHACGELGVLLLMFDIGLELRASDLRRIGLRAVGVAALGVTGTLALAWPAAYLLGASPSGRGALFVAATLAATSMGITGRVLREFGKTQSAEGRLVLAAAVLDDVMSLVLLAFVSALVGARAAGPGAAAPGLGALALRAVAFLVLAVVAGRALVPRLFALAARAAGEGGLLVFGLALCLGYGWAADLAGLAPVIGAFCAGLVVQPEDYRALARRPDETLEELVAPLLAFFVPVFFVLAGLQVDVRAFFQPRAWLLTLALGAAAGLGKLSAGLGAGRARSRLVVGVAMIPRGEVSLIFATAGAALAAPGGGALLPRETFNAVVVTVLASALLPPLALRRLFARKAKG